MATPSKLRMVPFTCTVCGARFEQAETAAIWRTCNTCTRALICLVNGIPTEVSPAVRAAIAAQEGK